MLQLLSGVASSAASGELPLYFFHAFGILYLWFVEPQGGRHRLSCAGTGSTPGIQFLLPLSPKSLLPVSGVTEVTVATLLAGYCISFREEYCHCAVNYCHCAVNSMRRVFLSIFFSQIHP